MRGAPGEAILIPGMKKFFTRSYCWLNRFWHQKPSAQCAFQVGDAAADGVGGNLQASRGPCKAAAADHFYEQSNLKDIKHGDWQR